MDILLIERSDDFRNLLKEFLELDGHHVTAVADPEDCPVYRRPDQPCPMDCPCGDAMLIDQHLKNMSGLEYIELQLDRGCVLSNRNKVLMAASWKHDEVDRAVKLGCTVWTKPVHLPDLRAWLKDIEKRLDE